MLTSVINDVEIKHLAQAASKEEFMDLVRERNYFGYDPRLFGGYAALICHNWWAWIHSTQSDGDLQ